MDKFKNINLNESRRKLNNWKRRINSNTLNMGLVKQDIPPPVDSILPSEVSSLCSRDDIFKLRSRIAKAKPPPPIKIPPPHIQKQKQEQKQKQIRPTSPLVFLDINKFKNRNYNTVNNIVKTEPKAQIQKIVQKPIIKNTTQKISLPNQNKIVPTIQQSIKPQQPPKQTKKQKPKYISKTYKIRNHKNINKKISNINNITLEKIKGDLHKKNIKLSENAPESLCRKLYLISNI